MVFREFCVPVPGSVRLSILVHHVLHVGVKISGKQMLGVYTLTVVARMKDVSLTRIAVSQLKGYAVSIGSLAVLMELTIAVRHQASRPFMASVFTYRHLCEKSLFQATLHIYPAFRAAWPYELSL